MAMEDTTRQDVLKRLNYIEGHLAGVRRARDHAADCAAADNAHSNSLLLTAVQLDVCTGKGVDVLAAHGDHPCTSGSASRDFKRQWRSA